MQPLTTPPIAPVNSAPMVPTICAPVRLLVLDVAVAVG